MDDVIGKTIVGKGLWATWLSHNLAGGLKEGCVFLWADGQGKSLQEKRHPPSLKWSAET